MEHHWYSLDMVIELLSLPRALADMLLWLKRFISEQPYFAAVIPAILCLIPLLVYEFIDRYNDLDDDQPTNPRKPRPPRVRYSLPWIGSALEMGKDPDTFFHRAREASIFNPQIFSELGPIFRVNAVGREITYVTSPDLISAVYRNTKAFEFSPIRLEISEKIFGLSHQATYSAFITEEYYPMHHRLFSPNNVVSLLHRYMEYARECVLKTVHTLDGHYTPLAPFLVPPAYSAAAHALFGRAFDAEKSYKPFRTFDNHFHLMVAGVPKFILPGPHRAWDQVGKMLRQYLKTPHGDASEVVLFLETSGRNAGWSERDIATALGSELWALQANAIFAAYWVIALELQKPRGLSALVAEVDRARTDWEASYPNQASHESRHQWLLNAPLPRLTSAIQEALRLSTSTFSIRRVTQPVEFAGYQFSKGERIVCVTRAVHLDKEIHPDPYEYNPERYLEGQKFKKNGKQVPNHSMPFGGGVSMCEGRHFAIGELKVYLALILSCATIELDPNSTLRPKYLTARMGVGLMPPVGDLSVKISKRDVAL